MRRWLLAALTLLALTPLVRANQAAQSWCESGAQLVITSGLTSTTQVQASYPSCTITVFVHGGGLAAIYLDNQATPTPLANPFTAQTNGQWQFYAANGHYDIQMSGAGMPTPVTYSDVILDDPGISGAGVVFGVYSSIPFSATPTFNAANASIFALTMTGNVTSSFVNAPVQNGQVIEIYLCQDAVGGRTFTFPSNFLNVSIYTITATASACTPTSWFYNGTNWEPFGGGGSGGGGGTTAQNPMTGTGLANGTFPWQIGPTAGNGDEVLCGPNPYIDIRCAGAVAVVPSAVPSIPGITATMSGSSPNVTLSSASTFANGNGVVVYGVGPLNANVPAAPTVTSCLAAAQTGTLQCVPAPVG